MSHPHPELSAPADLVEGGLRVIPLGGLGEVGRNMTVFEYDGRLLIVDCGVLFPEEHQPGVDVILPDFTWIRERLDKVVGVVLTHGHEDHIGGVPYLLKERPDIPLIGSRLTLALIREKINPIYIAMGWVAIVFLPDFAQGAYERLGGDIGTTVMVLIAAGGALYTLGGVVYGFQRPNPWPRWFGFHEVFHTFTILAFVTHYVGISMATYALR